MNQVMERLPSDQGSSLSESELKELLSSLSPQEIADLDRLLKPNPWEPIPGSPQEAAYYSEADELFYGGAAGGGKTDLLLGLAGNHHLNSILYRREYPQFKGILERSNEIWGGMGRFNSTAMLWRLTGHDGIKRLVEFGALNYTTDVNKYQGRPHDFIGFDEIGHFVFEIYNFLIGWNRSTAPDQRCRVVVTGNPPTEQDPGLWVVDYWGPWIDPDNANPAVPGELRWFARLDGKSVEVEGPDSFEFKGEEIFPKSRTFIPALLGDNPYLSNTNYRATIQGLDEPLRSKLLYGDFTLTYNEDPWRVIPTGWVSEAQGRHKRMPKEFFDSLWITHVGVDVARGGEDSTTIALRSDNVIIDLIEIPGRQTPDSKQVVAKIIDILKDRRVARDFIINVDVIGVGSAVLDMLQDKGFKTGEVNSAHRSYRRDYTGKFKFATKRSFIWWNMRDLLNPQFSPAGDQILLPDDRKLRQDLVAPRWSFGVRGVTVETKEVTIKRLGRSPDRADAVILAFADDSPEPQESEVPSDIADYAGEMVDIGDRF